MPEVCAATVTAADARGIRLDRTVFYPMGGGQPGDIGRALRSPDGAPIAIVDTIKGDGAATMCCIFPAERHRPARRPAPPSRPRSTGIAGTA